MTKQGVLGMDRKCRSETCSKWSFFRIGTDSKRCSWCGREFGRAEMGLDVTRFNTPKPKDPLPKQQPAMKVGKPKPGEYRS